MMGWTVTIFTASDEFRFLISNCVNEFLLSPFILVKNLLEFFTVRRQKTVFVLQLRNRCLAVGLGSITPYM